MLNMIISLINDITMMIPTGNTLMTDAGIINKIFALKTNENITTDDLNNGDCSTTESKYAYQWNDDIPMTRIAQCEYDMHESVLKPDGKEPSCIDHDADGFDTGSSERGCINYQHSFICIHVNKT